VLLRKQSTHFLFHFMSVEENAELITMPLHDACRRGNVLFLEEAILNGVSVNAS
jgi:hypothetical protein